MRREREMNSGQEMRASLSYLVAMRRKSLSTKAALDDVSAFIGTLVEGMDDDAVGFFGDDGLGAATYDFAAKVVAVIPFVAEERAHGRRERRTSGAAISAFWPGVRCSTTGRQSGSLSAWIFVVRPLASGRLLDCAPLFRRRHTGEL